jgi:hypothetical protein
VLNISERKKPLTAYGIEVNLALMKQGKMQTWLIDRIREKMPERYIDSSFINRVLTGQTDSPEIVAAINDILGFTRKD